MHHHFRPVWVLLALVTCNLQYGAQVISYNGLEPTAPAHGKHYSVSGIVMNSVTSEPIRRALVTLNSGPEQSTAFTGADGSFRIENVLEGQAFIAASRPGFFDPSSLAAVPGLPNRYLVGPGSNEFRIPLIPEAKLSGRALDDGEGIENISIKVLREQMVQGRKQWMLESSTSTDENGAFRLGALRPGRVVVCTDLHALPALTDTSLETYPLRCFPNSPDLASAQILDLPPGGDLRADFQLTPARGFRITGRISGTRNFGTNIWIEGPGGQPASLPNMRVSPNTGQFAIWGVPDGDYTCHFQANDGQGKTWESIHQIHVEGADVRELQVALQPGIDIPIQVLRPAQPAEIAAQPGATIQNTGFVQIHLSALDNPAGQTYYSSQQPNTEGEQNPPLVAISDVRPGRYAVRAQAFGQGCVDSISYGGADVAQQPLVVAPGASNQPLVVNVRQDCGSLNFSVAQGSRLQAGVVLMISDSSLFDPQVIPLNQGSGAFSLSNLSPGSYRVYALTNIDDLEYENPNALRDIPSQTVTVEANGKGTLVLDFVDRSKRP